MSLINTLATEINWGTPFPGITLFQYREIRTQAADEPYKTLNGVALFEGVYGLTILNDPFVLFRHVPHRDGTAHLSDKQVDALEGAEREVYSDQLNQDVAIYRIFERDLTGNIQEMSHLSKALEGAGYDPEEHGFPGIFVSNALADWLEDRKPESTYRRMDLPQDEIPDFSDFGVHATDRFTATRAQLMQIDELLANPYLMRAERVRVQLNLYDASEAYAHLCIVELQHIKNYRTEKPWENPRKSDDSSTTH